MCTDASSGRSAISRRNASRSPAWTTPVNSTATGSPCGKGSGGADPRTSAGGIAGKPKPAPQRPAKRVHVGGVIGRLWRYSIRALQRPDAVRSSTKASANDAVGNGDPVKPGLVLSLLIIRIADDNVRAFAHGATVTRVVHV